MTTLTWMDDALCAPMPGFLNLTTARQKAICADCPVREFCADWSDANDISRISKGWPIYGGLTGGEQFRRHAAKAKRKSRARIDPYSRTDGQHECHTGLHPEPTNSCYQHGCRCDACRADHKEAARKGRMAAR